MAEYNLIKRSEFIEKWLSIKNQYKNGKEAFYAVSDEFREKYDADPRWSSYESFRVAIHRSFQGGRYID